ncbi:DNA primase [Consotaella salsifontis]|uniref:DNA primase n=1 Tax=Consotaella salsifontis TaxID=1365950 RepID=A0A1T4PSB2_9HYPH|nr:DNA primase [Consotaella salsifontis]SJZ94146.1 DNA primase [Consotaella salsifontis]
MKFPASFLDDIRERVRISDVIGRRVTWDRRKSQPAKGDFWACCPFHGEKSASFHCEDTKGRYHCFGCGVSGDHFRFLTEAEGLSFPEAVERLAGEAGLPMPARDADAERREERRTTLFDALRLAQGFFRATLAEADGARARAYLRDRGLHPETQRAFGIGYAPDGRNRLKEFLAGKGVGREEIEGAGLVVHGPEIPVSYDRFRDRIMFPILDTQERVIAFGGRALQPGVPAKYLNSPETDVFHKGATLYNLAKARRATKAAGTMILVEGYVDVIALAQAGFENAVAPLGTALTERQIELLWREAGEPVLCFDGDAAGLKAAHRAAEMALALLKPGRSLRFVLLPSGRDPDDLVREEGREAFSSLVSQARPLADLLWMRETQGGLFDTPERRADLEQRLKSTVQRIGDESVRRHYHQDMAERLSSFFGPAPEPARRSSGKGGYRRNEPAPRHGGASRRVAISDRLSRSGLVRKTPEPAIGRTTAIIIGFINHPTLIYEAFEQFAGVDLPSGDLERLRSCVLDICAERLEDDRDALVEELRSRGLGGVFDAYETRLRNLRCWPALAGAAPEDAREAIRQALHLHHRFRSLTKELKLAEEALGTGIDEAAYAQIVEIKREIEDLTGTEALIDGFGVLSGRPARTY